MAGAQSERPDQDEPVAARCLPIQPNSASDHMLEHELVRDTVFLTIPQPLLDAAVNEIGRERFDPQRLELEYALSRRCGDHSATVGLWRGTPIQYPLLHPSPMPSTSEECAEAFGMENLMEMASHWDMKVAHVVHCLRVASGPATWIQTISRGYVGWLICTPEFRQEHDSLFTEWRDEVQKWGVPQLGPLVSSGPVLSGVHPIADDRSERYCRAFAAFFIRWRLRQLAAPYLPFPIEPLMSGDVPATVLGQLRNAGGFFFLPDIFPVPSRDQLRQLLDDPLRGTGGPEHLADWTKMIRRNNPAKNAIPTFARRFQLQHYWRLFHTRHSHALARNATKLKSAFAKFLDIKLRVLMNDLAFLKKKLGADWESRPTISY